MNNTSASRRRFLAAGATAIAAPYFIPASALGLADKPAPSNRINIGMIGAGRQGYNVNLPWFLYAEECQVVAMCEADGWRLERARKHIEDHYSVRAPGGKYQGCATTKDFRELLARKDVDAVMISTADHWHAVMAIEAAKAGKDVALEKPICLSVEEGRKIADAMQKYGRISRTDSEARFYKPFHQMCELVRNGRVGKIQRILCGTPKEHGAMQETPAPMPVPEELDYNMWQGPVAERPYTQARVHPIKDGKDFKYNFPGWMQIQDYSHGMILNWGAHIIDIVQWGHNSDRSGPVEVEGKGDYPAGAFWNVMQGFDVNYRYEDGVEVNYKMVGRPFVRIEGADGWIEVEWFSKTAIKASKPEMLKDPLPENAERLPLISEKQDFINSIKSRKETLEPLEVGHRTASMCLIGQIACKLGRKLKWDPKAEKFAGDDEANKLLSRGPMRGPWQI